MVGDTVVLADIVLGILGGIFGGWLFSKMGMGPSSTIRSIIVAFIGAVFLVGITRLVKRA